MNKLIVSLQSMATKLANENYKSEAEKLLQVVKSLQFKKAQLRSVRLIAYLYVFEGTPIFDDMVEIETSKLKSGETITLDKKDYTIREIEDYLDKVRVIITKGN
jgi:hypothetical protein